MHLQVNGKRQVVKDAKTLEELLEELGYERDSVAVAQNGCFIPKQQYAQLMLKEEMDLEVLVPMQGG